MFLQIVRRKGDVLRAGGFPVLPEQFPAQQRPIFFFKCVQEFPGCLALTVVFVAVLQTQRHQGAGDGAADLAAAHTGAEERAEVIGGIAVHAAAPAGRAEHCLTAVVVLLVMQRNGLFGKRHHDPSLKSNLFYNKSSALTTIISVIGAEILREKGTDRSKFFRGQVDKYRWMDFGSSYLPSELNAAYLYAQLEARDRIFHKRMEIYNYYIEVKRYNPSTLCYEYFILLGTDKFDEQCRKCRVDDYCRLKVALHGEVLDFVASEMKNRGNIQFEYYETEDNYDVWRIV